MYRPDSRVDHAHASDVWSLDWRGDCLLTGSLDGSAKCWVATGDLKTAQTSPLQEHMGIVSAVLLPDCLTAITCSQDAMIRFYDVPLMTEVGSIDAGIMQAYKLCVSPEGDLLASGNSKGQVNLWSVQEKEKVSTIPGGDKFIMASCFDDEGKQIATADVSGSVNVIDVLQQQVLHTVKVHTQPARSITYSNGLLFTASDDRHVCVLDMRSGVVVNSFPHSGLCLSVAPSPDQRHFVTGCSNHTVCVWDLGMQRMQQTFNAQHTEQVWAVSFDKADPLGKRFASVGDDGILQTYKKS
jgi:WD40 repeat protein